MFLILNTVYFTNYIYHDNFFGVAEEVGENLITWFSYNQMKLNPGKCHQFLNTKEQITVKVYR